MPATPISRARSRRGFGPRCLVLACAGLCSLAPVRAEIDIQFAATYTADLLANRSGGIATGTRYLDNLDVELVIDFEPGTGHRQNRLLFRGLYNNGARFSNELAGDLQVVSNIEADEAWRLFEAWYELGSERWSLRTGLYDLNSEFDVNEAGALFLHSSHGIGADLGQTGRNGPGIFPVSAFALRGRLSVGTGDLRLAVLDGVPGDPGSPGSNRVSLNDDDGALLIGQVSLPLRGSVRTWGGYWRYTERRERPYDGGAPAVDQGWYLGIEGSPQTAVGPVGWFLRFGSADPDVNIFANYAGAGLVFRSPFASRPRDRVGIAVASAGAGSAYRGSLEQAGKRSGARESAWELTYRVQLGDHLVLQPDVQYVRHPAANSEIDDALVVGVRVELAY